MEVSMSELAAAYRVEQKIFFIRGMKVMLSHDLAELYGVETKNLNKAVNRNLNRFPADFMFQLSPAETDALKFQIGTSKEKGRGGRRRALPYAFTEQGVAMLSSVLRSERAARVNIEVMRAFVKLRETLALHKDLAGKLEALEMRIGDQDAKIKAVFNAIRRMMRGPKKPKRRIGFNAEEKRAKYRA
jgi:hypothetical protein